MKNNHMNFINMKYLNEEIEKFDQDNGISYFEDNGINYFEDAKYLLAIQEQRTLALVRTFLYVTKMARMIKVNNQVMGIKRCGITNLDTLVGIVLKYLCRRSTQNIQYQNNLIIILLVLCKDVLFYPSTERLLGLIQGERIDRETVRDYFQVSQNVIVV